jgi:hypothetical protein
MSSRMFSCIVGLALVLEANAIRRFNQPDEVNSMSQLDEVNAPSQLDEANSLPNAIKVDAVKSTSFLNLSSSPNASLIKSLLDSSMHAGWATLPTVGPDAHPPLLPSSVKPYPALLKIDKSFDFGGLAGSTHVVSGVGAPLALNGNFGSRHFGHDRVKVYANGMYEQGKELFQMTFTKHIWNPLKYRFSYRILKPSQQKTWNEDEDVLFTINRDLFGRGFLWTKDEYRIYQGRERGNKMVYYCVQSWWGWVTRCWHNKLEYESGRSSLTVSGHPGPKYAPCAVLSQKVNGGALSPAFASMTLVPDKYYLYVSPGEDTALLSALGALVDGTQSRMPGAGIDVNVMNAAAR